MMSRTVAKHLQLWGYDLRAEDFGTNYLSDRVSLTRSSSGEPDGEIEFAFASLCAVPHRRITEIYGTYDEFLSWLQPQSLIQCEPPGVWLPTSGRTFASAGVILHENAYGNASQPWRAYLLATRDGYFEYGRRAARQFRKYTVFPFSPMVAWIQRFISMVRQAKAMQTHETNYTIVLNLPSLAHSSLGLFGAGWPDPFRWEGDPVPTAIERRTQIWLDLHDAEPKQIAHRFAERLDNVFGAHEAVPRCYNHPNSDGKLGPPGELPSNRLEFGF